MGPTTMLTTLVAFLGVSAVVICTPGQDTALTIRNVLAGGRRAGVLTAAGVAGGQAVWSLAASAGVARLLQASEPAFVALKIAGATYLAYLGARALYAAFTARGDDPGRALPGPRPGRYLPLRQGFLSNLGNPKMAAFFTSLLPQFAPGGHATFTTLLPLGLLFCLLTLVWLSAYSIAVARARKALLRPRIRRALDGLTGVALIGLGVRLASERR